MIASRRSYDLTAGAVDTIGRHDDIATSVAYSCEKGEVISAGLDEKIKLWDTRQGESLLFSIDADQPFESCASQVEVPIRCVTSVPHSRGYAAGSVDGRVALDIPNISSSSEINGSGTDNKGYVISWNVKSRRILSEVINTKHDLFYLILCVSLQKFPRYSNIVVSMTFNHTDELLAVASSHTYQEPKEKEEAPQVFIHRF